MVESHCPEGKSRMYISYINPFQGQRVVGAAVVRRELTFMRMDTAAEGETHCGLRQKSEGIRPDSAVDFEFTRDGFCCGLWTSPPAFPSAEPVSEPSQ